MGEGVCDDEGRQPWGCPLILQGLLGAHTQQTNPELTCSKDIRARSTQRPSAHCPYMVNAHACIRCLLLCRASRRLCCPPPPPCCPPPSLQVDDLRKYLRMLGLSDEGSRYVLRDRLVTMMVVRKAATAGDVDHLLTQLASVRRGRDGGGGDCVSFVC